MNEFDDETPAGYRDADLEMADLQAAGNRAARGRRRMIALRAAGKLAEAADACSHGAGYSSPSPAAVSSQDPRAAEAGYRCTDCGSWFAGKIGYFDVRTITPTIPCELKVKA